MLQIVIFESEIEVRNVWPIRINSAGNKKNTWFLHLPQLPFSVSYGHRLVREEDHPSQLGSFDPFDAENDNSTNQVTCFIGNIHEIS